jgi:hypothetical protein
LAFFKLDSEKLVDSLFIVESVHDGQINDTAEVDQVRFCPILDAFLLFHH